VRPGLISPTRSVPAGIDRPDYASSGQPAQRASRAVRTPTEIQAMRLACRVAAEALVEVGRHVAAGVTTDELDRVGHDAMVDAGAYPSTLNYRGYPKSLCSSVNEVICHGIPDSRRLHEGDIVNIDVTAFIEGVHGDTSATFLVGEVDETSLRLVRTAREALHAGIATVRPGTRVHEIGRAIEAVAHPEGFSVVREFIGHGIGDQFHTSLQIPHYFDPRHDTMLVEGMTFTIEPMINVGTHQLATTWDDDWTVTTRDGQRSAQFEHTILVTETGHEVLTLPGEGRPAEANVLDMGEPLPDPTSRG
jgi:methionyl aminopeptidase